MGNGFQLKYKKNEERQPRSSDGKNHPGFHPAYKIKSIVRQKIEPGPDYAQCGVQTIL